MIEIEFMAREPTKTVLAGEFVARVDIVTAKAYLPLRDAVVGNQQYHPRNPNHPIYQPHSLVVGRDRQIAPAVKVEGLILRINCFSNALVQQDEGPPN